MKKYSMYALVFCILLSGIFSLAIWSKRNDFSLGLRVTSDYENTTVGDPNEIKDLEYELTITDGNKQFWIISGQGETMTTEYQRDNYSSRIARNTSKDDLNHYYRFLINPVMNESYIDPDNVRKASSEGYTTEGFDYSIADVTKVDYECELRDFDENKIDSFTFQVDAKNPEEPLEMNFDIQGYDGSDIEIYDGLRSTRKKTFTNMNKSDTSELQNDKYSFFYISPAGFNFNTKNVKFSKPIGGIYRIDHQKNVKQIVEADLDQTLIYKVALLEDKLYAIIENKGSLYIQQYDENGNILKQQKLGIEEELAEAEINFYEGNILLHTSLVDDILNKRTTIINFDNFRIEKTFDYMDKGSESMYKYKDGKLTIVSSDYSNLYIRVIQEEKTLYDSEFFGDYQDDQKITMSAGNTINQGVSSSAIHWLLYSNQRNIHVNWIK